MNTVKVHIIEAKNRKFYMMRFTDPTTGEQSNRSTKVERTGRRKDRLAAERVAAKWEEELREGRYRPVSNIRWAEFRERYENEAMRARANSTAEKVLCVFNSVEQIVSPKHLSDLTSERLSIYQRKLRERGLSEATIKSYLAHLKAALRWAHDREMLISVPKIAMPLRVPDRMKGRPISETEFARMLDSIEAGLLAAYQQKRGKKANPNRKRHQSMETLQRMEARALERIDTFVPAWKRLLTGLWLSGLRLGEALELSWDRDDRMRIDFSGRRPFLRIPAESEKGYRNRLLPITPDFAEFLLQTPACDRRGLVFQLPSARKSGELLQLHRVSAIIAAIGKAAGIEVSRDKKTGKVKHASAHDLRRSFGERWAALLMPQLLMELMRHEKIETTLNFYVGQNAERSADAIFAAYERFSNTLGNSKPVSSNSPFGEGAEHPGNQYVPAIEKVVRAGIEPATHGFSVHCSTN